ncbi:transcription factor subunit Med10 of mediator complex-domain-containing protein [Hysterangium stoloniferum]|nr:transcription factor subunit Med10 of mediator complex-domain-containing protein [Hysterangium stoloniferum]
MSPLPNPDTHSPRSSQSPPPEELSAVHDELLGLAHALYNLGTTVLEDLSKETGVEKPVGARVNEVIQHLASIGDLSQGVQTMIPYQVLVDIDNGRNPMNLTRERIERAAVENQFMNGKIDAVQSYKSLLDAALAEHFPSLASHVGEKDAPDHDVKPNTNGIGESASSTQPGSVNVNGDSKG